MREQWMTKDSSSAAHQLGPTAADHSLAASTQAVLLHDREFYSTLTRDLHDLKNLLWPAAVQADCASSASSSVVLADLLKRLGDDVEDALTIAGRMSDLIQHHLESKSPPESERMAPFSRRAPQAAQSRMRILCVDNDPIVRGALINLIAYLGHDVDAASSGTEALTLVGSHKYDVVLTEMHLTDMDARGITARIRELGRTPVIWLVGADDACAGTNSDGLNPPSCILTKPLSLGELRKAFDKVTAGPARSTTTT